MAGGFAASGTQLLIGDKLRTTRDENNSDWDTVTTGVRYTSQFHHELPSLGAEPFLTITADNLMGGVRAGTRHEIAGKVLKLSCGMDFNEEELTRLLIGFLGNDVASNEIWPNIYNGELIPPLMDVGWQIGQGYMEGGISIEQLVIKWAQSSSKYNATINGNIEYRNASPVALASVPEFVSGALLGGPTLAAVGVPTGCELMDLTVTLAQGSNPRLCAGEAYGSLAENIEYGGHMTAQVAATFKSDGTIDITAPGDDVTDPMTITFGALILHIGPCHMEPGTIGQDGLLTTASATWIGSHDSVTKPIAWVTNARA